MSEILLVGFLVAHGLLHLAIWVPQPPPDADPPPPFHPDHSAVMTAVSMTSATARGTSIGLAATASAAYLLAALTVALDAGVAVVALVVAAGIGLLLKALFFHPWLTVGVLLDVLVVTSALADWPVTVG
jgi:hypothetical protein